MNEYVLQDGIPVFWVDDKAEIIYVQTEGKKCYVSMQMEIHLVV